MLEVAGTSAKSSPRADRTLGKLGNSPSRRASEVDVQPVGHSPTYEAASSRVAILLASWNGARFIEEQLNSFAGQTHGNWSLHISDDGSSDQTREIIHAFASRSPNLVTLREGPRSGCQTNFFSLLRDPSIDADYFAFSDQDDVWCLDKLERAVQALRVAQDSQAALYCSRSELIDEHGRHIGFSTSAKKPPSFRNAIVENIAGGNTMVFNRASRAVLSKISDDRIVMHDWTAYIAITAVGGRILYDQRPSLGYRQHANNVIGARSNIRARFDRVSSGKWRDWTTVNLAALEQLRSEMTAENIGVLDSFVQMRKSASFAERYRCFLRSRVYRQTVVGQIGLLVGVIGDLI
ncbi:glycosyltransferase family 2 protein [Bradyrhizobium sp. USDA 4353]